MLHRVSRRSVIPDRCVEWPLTTQTYNSYTMWSVKYVNIYHSVCVYICRKVWQYVKEYTRDQNNMNKSWRCPWPYSSVWSWCITTLVYVITWIRVQCIVSSVDSTEQNERFLWYLPLPTFTCAHNIPIKSNIVCEVEVIKKICIQNDQI